MTTIVNPPRFVEVRCGDDPSKDESLYPWLRMSWREFADANPDEANDVASDLAVYGMASLGGGAAPIVRIRRSR